MRTGRARRPRSWLPSTAKVGDSPASAACSRASPRGCESRSPVTSTRSGRRSRTHSAARSTECAPREGTPRWKSDRCASRSPSSSGGNPASATSRSRRRTQPASKWPQASPAAAAPRAPSASCRTAIAADRTGARSVGGAHSPESARRRWRCPSTPVDASPAPNLRRADDGGRAGGTSRAGEPRRRALRR